jgi:hypothetical protein
MLGRGQTWASLRAQHFDPPRVHCRDRRCLPASAIADDEASARETAMDLNKVNWAQVGRVTDPGRYMFKFGWLTITADDLAVWQVYPNAAFTLISATPPAPVEGEEQPAGEEFRLGAFEVPIDSGDTESAK